MIVAGLSQQDVRQRLRREGLLLRTGPVVSRVRSSLEAVADGIALHYARHAVEPDDGFADFHISVDRPSGLRRWWRPQVEFRFDGQAPFSPLPGDQGFPMLEWGLNWCISSHCHQYLIIHAAVLERGGHAMVLPAPPGSGKSTLTAGLAFRGWRLLSDELAVFRPEDRQLLPVPRPISLKNASIDVLRAFEPAALLNAQSGLTPATVLDAAKAREIWSPIDRNKAYEPTAGVKMYPDYCVPDVAGYGGLNDWLRTTMS